MKGLQLGERNCDLSPQHLQQFPHLPSLQARMIHWLLQQNCLLNDVLE